LVSPTTSTSISVGAAGAGSALGEGAWEASGGASEGSAEVSTDAIWRSSVGLRHRIRGRIDLEQEMDPPKSRSQLALYRTLHWRRPPALAAPQQLAESVNVGWKSSLPGSVARVCQYQTITSGRMKMNANMLILVDVFTIFSIIIDLVRHIWVLQGSQANTASVKVNDTRLEQALIQS